VVPVLESNMLLADDGSNECPNFAAHAAAHVCANSEPNARTDAAAHAAPARVHLGSAVTQQHQPRQQHGQQHGHEQH
jgi:hypothetical protein